MHIADKAEKHLIYGLVDVGANSIRPSIYEAEDGAGRSRMIRRS
jgi:hypothetical protein